MKKGISCPEWEGFVVWSTFKDWRRTCWQATGASSAHGARRKKVKGNLPKKSKISWEPLPSTSQDYSSSSDLENFEEDEASSKTWTIVERKLLNHHVLEQSASCRFCESDSVLKFWRSGKHWTRRRMGMRFPKNSRTTILRLIELKLYIFKSRPVQNLISQRDHRSCKQDRILRIRRIFWKESSIEHHFLSWHSILSLLPLHRCKNHVFTTNLARDMKFFNFFFHTMSCRAYYAIEKNCYARTGNGC